RHGPRALVRQSGRQRREHRPRRLHRNPPVAMGATRMRWISLLFLGLLAAGSASAIERETARELRRERGERIEHEEDEGEDPEARYREQRKLNEGQTSDAALLERL